MSIAVVSAIVWVSRAETACYDGDLRPPSSNGMVWMQYTRVKHESMKRSSCEKMRRSQAYPPPG